MRPARSPWSGPSSCPNASAWYRAPARRGEAPPIPGGPGSGAHQPRLMEPISDAADGFDELAGVAKLLPQALDVNVDGPLQHDGVLTNRGIHELVARERPPRLANQDFQEPELGRRQGKFLVAVDRLVAVPVNHDPLALDHRAGGRLFLELDPPQLFLDPLDQDLHAVRLGDVIIGAGGETHELVRFLGLGRDHDDGNVPRPR